MSIALDLALVIRDSLNNLGLSVANIGVAYTLAFRVGSNSCSWVSQQTLSEELNISESNVRLHCNKLKQVGLIDIQKDSKDRRKNLYSFNPEIVNYHAMKDAQKEKCRLKLGDTFRDSAYFQAVNTAQKQAVLSEVKTSTAPVVEPKNEDMISPKAKEERNIKSKGTFSCPSDDGRDSLFNEFWSAYPRKEDKQDAIKCWSKAIKLEKPENIIADVKIRTANHIPWQTKQYIPLPPTYLNKRQWTNDIITKGMNKNGSSENSSSKGYTDDQLLRAAHRLNNAYVSQGSNNMG